ncbi:MAG: hypothetical protein C4330_07645 [Chitinophagaceae bacterium]
MRKIFVVAAVIFSSQLQAQDLGPRVGRDSVLTVVEANVNGKTLDNLVVTANKFPKKQSQTGKVVSVIDRATIQQMGGRTLNEVLNTVAGTTIINANSNMGSNQRISLRGSSDGNALVLIDGIPVNDPSVINNYFDLNLINIDQVERIEVMKGAHSTLYGSDAVYGVINIITKKSATNRFAPYASLAAGSYNTFKATAGFNGQTNKLFYDVHATTVASTGFSSAYDSVGNKGFDKDGYYQKIVGGNLGFKLSSKVQWNFFTNYSTYKTDLDAGAFKDDKDYFTRSKNYQAGTGFTWNQPGGTLHVNYHFDYNNRFYHDDSTDRSSFAYFSQSDYIGRTHYAEVYETYQWNHVELLAGIDYRFNNTMQDYFSQSSYGPYAQPTLYAKSSQLSGYASVVYNYHNFNIEVGGRWNNHNVYGNNFTYTFNPSYLINNSVKVFANLASAFKAPTLYQLFDPYAGNSNLQPEKSNMLEGGVEVYTAQSLKVRAVGFYNKINNAIQYITVDPVNYVSRYTNINNQKTYGGELEADYKTQDWLLKVNYTYTKGQTTSNYSAEGNKRATDTTYSNLYRVPEHAANLFASYNVTKQLSVSSLLKFTGKRWEPIYGKAPKQLDSYFTVDLSAQYRFSNQLRAFVDFKNITNQQYFDVWGYTTRKFNFMAGLSINL